MAGFTDYTAANVLRYVSGQTPMPTANPPGVWVGLFTTAPTADIGTGGTEVTGGAYARVQVAGSLTAASTISAASATITMPSNPGWVVPGMTVFDTTNAFANGFIGTVLTYIGTTLTLTANAAHAGTGATDNLVFSAFQPPTASSGTEPSVVPEFTNNSGVTITFPQSTASWGNVLAWGLFDAVTSGNLLWFDFLGNFSWLPFTVSSASPGVLTAKAHGYSASDPVVITSKFDGTLPTFSQSNFTNTVGTLLVTSPATDTFTLTNAGTAVNTSSTGSGQVRKIVVQSIPINVTASFASAAFILSLA